MAGGRAPLTAPPRGRTRTYLAGMVAQTSSGPLLIVEDDVDICEALQAYLELHGHAVRVARNGREALEQLAQPPRPALMVLDMALPVMDGHRVLTTRKASEALAQVPVIILSAGMAEMNPRDWAVYASSYNVAAFLKKPVEPRRLLEAIERFAPKPAGSQAGTFP
ncbi:response regulator [Myxococcus xanthus DK 1622]|uniref:Response regulator n=2 Tax=Myxococcaceae TaxID=31 RepID=Q1CX33_MYXXD|nr:response regulator [Myxococcus xanthus DK 1622]NOJ51215.1 response regulator [Myxococcus xanthus]QPM79213.1 response regulator [Myxococcus xanthus]QVW68291.1 response regulator [Myxococcus xanthus DZ2]UEO05595.1 response regulator [Myxococcus xanthus DZ2]